MKSFFYRLWSFLFPIVVCRQPDQTIAELRKGSHFSEGQRYRQTQPPDPRKLRCDRVRGTVKSLDQWYRKHGHRRSA